ncbi:MAG TPA: hypothetical protein VLT59_15460 [Steroidobacteraceae bacterium]|nr:hypothetical protein [Steroidobacteraceae bacterium]
MASDLDSTQVLPPPKWSDPRIHLLDDTWLLTIFAVLLATALPWLRSAFEVRFIAVALGLVGLGAIHVAFTTLERPQHAGSRRPILTSLHIAGVVIVGVIWISAGGVQNPAFLMVFALPVVGAIFLSRWQPYLMAVVSILVVGAVALAQSPELRFYVPGLNAAGAWLATVLGPQGAASQAPFPGFYAPSGYFLVLLEVFAIFIFACAVASEYLGTVFDRLHSQADLARAEAKRGQALWTTMIETLPAPALLVDADTLRIVCASERALRYCTGDAAMGTGLLETVRFSYPDVVQDLVATGDGGASPSGIRVGERLYATELRVVQLVQGGSRLALLLIHDLTEEVTLKSALDVTGQAVIVIDGRGRVVTFNEPARVLFATIERDLEAAELLTLEGKSPRWWDPGASGRRKMDVEIPPRVFQVTISSASLPGEEERLYVVAFLPVARAAIGEQGTLTGRRRAGDTTTSDTNPRLVAPR